MGFSISKNSGATVYTITHFESINFEADDTVHKISNILSDDEATILIKLLGPETRVTIDWTIIPESSSVVSGTGAPVTGAPEQVNYLFDTFRSQGESQLTDTYTLTITFSGGTTFQRTGTISKIAAPIAASNPLVFNGHLVFEVGTVT